MRPLQSERTLSKIDEKAREKSEQWDSRLSAVAQLSKEKYQEQLVFFLRFSSHTLQIWKTKSHPKRMRFDFSLERAMGLEPTTAAMARRYSSQLSYARTPDILWIFWKMQEKT